VLERFSHRLAGDLVEAHAKDVALAPELLGNVPGDRLTLSVGVGGEVDFFLVLRGFFELVDDLLLAVDDLVFGLEVLLDVHAELGLRQVDDVPHRRLHLVIPSEILGERARLGRRFDDDQILRHVSRMVADVRRPG